MKTPREILLEQHRTADARLDAVRTSVVAATQPKESSGGRRTLSPGRVWARAWQELFWPCRYAWTGIAALWLVLWGINSGISATPQKALAGARRLPASFVQTVQEQQKLLTELIPPAESQPVEPPRRNPRPRSQRFSCTFNI